MKYSIEEPTKLEDLIYYGTDAKEGEYPHMVTYFMIHVGDLKRLDLVTKGQIDSLSTYTNNREGKLFESY